MPFPLPNLRHLFVIREVLRRGSTSAAARAMHLTQPAATQAVAAVERIFGARLFERSSVGMNLTAAGKMCLPRIERALAQIEAAIAEARPVKPGKYEPVWHAMSTTHLQAFIAFVEHRGFSAAARATSISRPSLHRAARDLERRIGTPLFEKTSYGLGPTREAAQLARRVRLAFIEIEQGRAAVSALVGTDCGRSVIGAMPLARSFLVPSAVLQFVQDHPRHTVSILDGPYDSLIDALRAGSADILIGALRERMMHGDLIQEHLFDDPLAIVVRAAHPLTQRKRLNVRDLARYSWIAARPGSPLRQHFDAMFVESNLSIPAGIIECNSLVAARALLLASDRVMLLSAHQIRHEVMARQLVAMPHPLGRITRSIGLTMRRGWQPTAAQQSLLDVMRNVAASLPA